MIVAIETVFFFILTVQYELQIIRFVLNIETLLVGCNPKQMGCARKKASASSSCFPLCIDSSMFSS